MCHSTRPHQNDRSIHLIHEQFENEKLFLTMYIPGLEDKWDKLVIPSTTLVFARVIRIR